MMQKLTRVAVVLGGLAAFVSCSPMVVLCVEGDEETCDAGSLPPDSCNTVEEAKTGACTLTLCQDREAFISTMPDGGADVDFYSVTLPGNLTARSLLSLKAGYGGVPQTAVNFSLNVLREQPDGGLAAIASGNDQRMGAAAPKNIEITQPFADSNAQLVLRLSDIGGVVMPRVDNRNTYKVNVCVIENPDSNEPNDATPTAITLTASGAIQQGMGTGYLATPDDKDVFSFPVSGARQIIYVRISSAMTNLMPPLAYRMAYTLKDPMGRPVAEGVMDNQFLQVDLSTARLSAGDGTYTLEVYGYKTAQQMTPAPGDLRLKYDVDVRVMPDLDMSESSTGNDSAATARPTNLVLNTPTTLTGRISYIPDTEYFRLNLPGRSGPATLRYELLPSTGTGRFPPLSQIPTRQIRVVQEITTGATVQDRQNACISNAAVCPRSFTDPLSSEGQLVLGVCRSPGIDPPHCVLGERNEENQIPALASQKNFVGAIPVASTVTSLIIAYGDTGRGRLKWADDRDWSIRVVLEADPDEQRPAVTQVTLGTPPTVTGVISHGYGKTLEFDDLNMGRGIRGPNDYDATETDVDRFRFDFPNAMAGDQAWNLEWVFGSPDSGSPPGELALEMTFCQMTLGDGGCTGSRGIITPTYGKTLTPWYLPPVLANTEVQFVATRNGGETRVRVEPVACYCFPRAVVASGQVLMNVLAVDRTSNDSIPYSITQSVGAYPTSYPNRDGGAGMSSCPPTTDGGVDGGSAGGCRFGLGR